MALELNRLHQGDCVEKLAEIEAGTIDLCFADPPFNIGYKYDVYDDRQDDGDYLDWCQQWMAGVHRALRPDGTFWLAIGDEYAAELKVRATRELGFVCRSWVIWYYTFGVNCKYGFSRSHTHLFHFVKDPEAFTFNSDDPAIRVPSARQLVYGDGRANPKGRLPDNTWVLRPQDLPEGFQSDGDTWYFPRVAGTFKERQGFHGCQMPEQLMGRIVRACSNPGDTVLDPFAGSGTTLVVAKKLGRQWLGSELSPEYAARIEQRLDETEVGAPLSGAENPLTSVPNTANGKRQRGITAAAQSRNGKAAVKPKATKKKPAKAKPAKKKPSKKKAAQQTPAKKKAAAPKKGTAKLAKAESPSKKRPAKKTSAVKKSTAKKTAVKKTAVPKAAVKKAAATKTVVKKAVAAKVSPEAKPATAAEAKTKKGAVKKKAIAKATPKKVAAVSTQSEPPATKKGAKKKASARQTTAAKATPKKKVAKKRPEAKSTPKKSVKKKVETKQVAAATKKSKPKKAAKSTAAKQVAAKKVVVKKVAVKKRVAKKASAATQTAEAPQPSSESRPVETTAAAKKAAPKKRAVKKSTATKKASKPVAVKQTPAEVAPTKKRSSKRAQKKAAGKPPETATTDELKPLETTPSSEDTPQPEPAPVKIRQPELF
ncbi:DNA adenine methyltransferase YhdJ [Rosistilla oblonga]|uniref:DNA methyltransferase n=1 Tax=Rosistilla oblonga TaxID=2527990 RepID=UPI0011879D41|nr:DNA methyltransferase [Rosistilla oblonga]QDV12470.1 DNA adenine methyltransferase YhdJ [Rosistilla oblonga]